MDTKESMKSIHKSSKQSSQSSNKRERKPKSKQEELIEGLKMEIASELGILDQVQNKGWQSLSPRESGKLGGILAQKLKKIKNPLSEP